MPVDDPPINVLLTFDFEEWEGRGRLYEADLYSKTKRLVDLLLDLNLKATFFLDAETVLKYPQAFQLLIDRRMELSLHSDKHFGGRNGWLMELDFASQRTEQQIARMKNAILMIRQIMPDFEPRGFRSPGLRWNEDLYSSLQQLHLTYDSSQQDKFAFKPFLKRGVTVLPVNCGDYDSACYKMRAQLVVGVWKDNFLRAYRSHSREAPSYYMLLMHPSVIGKHKYLGMLKAILNFLSAYNLRYLTCSELVAEYSNVKSSG